jgi:replicative superfamily II helicase
MAQIRTKALLKEISDKPPNYNWSYTASQVIRNMTGAVFTLQEIGETNPIMLDEFEGFTLQLARTWERLAKLVEGTSTETAIMNAAVMYELAGYQANAVCLSKKIGFDFSEIQKPTVSQLTNAFMQRLFLRLSYLAKNTQLEPDLDCICLNDLSMSIYMGITGKAFEQAGYFFLNGDISSLNLAKDYLKLSERAFAGQGCVLEANLVRNIRSLLPAMAQRSTWLNFNDLINQNPRWRRYLKLLSRGIGNNMLESPSISELWPSQVLAVKDGLLDPNSSKIIRMPTSAGKTRVAELAIAHTLTTIPDAKCVYVAPYRALVSELEQSFLNLFSDLGFQVTSIVGSYETNEFEQLLVSDADIWVMTPEKLDLLKRAKPEFLDKVRLFVLDEAHVVNDEGRGVKFELLLSRLQRRLTNARFLFLSAVVPQETLLDFATWFSAKPGTDIMSTDWRPSHQRVAMFEWQGSTGVLRYSQDEDTPLLNEFVPGIVTQQKYETIGKNGRRTSVFFPDFNSKSQIAAELTFKFAELGPVLIFCSQPNFVGSVAKALERRLYLARSKDKSLPTYFLKGASSRAANCAKEWLGETHPVTNFLNNGIAVHYGDLPDAVRKAVETDFRNREFQILVATNTLAQGVNLPIRTVIVHSCWRYSKEEERPKRIPARDYWNIAGRAGRAGQETEGTIIHIVQKFGDIRDYEYYYQKRKDVEPVRSALFRLLEDLMEKRISEDNLSEILDPEILALLVEEGTDFFHAQNVLEKTLVNTQAKRMNLSTKPLSTVFEYLAEGIDKTISDKALLKVYSSTGLCSESCIKLGKYIQENGVRIKHLLKNAGPTDVNEIASIFLSGCINISEMRPEREFGGSYEALLLSWLKGTSVPQIVAEFSGQVTSLEELAKFIEDLFEYRLPWGLSALIEISKKELGINDRELSLYVQYFPAMVKFGVPTPEASWALTEGVPFRQIAIEIASKFIQEKSLSCEREDFIKWLSKFSSEQLHFEFGLEGQVLDDVNQALSRAGRNELLFKNTAIEEILPYETDVVGTSYENRFVVAATAKIGDDIELIRDYDNPSDRNAIRAELNGQVIGYLERQLAQLAAVDIDCGLNIKGIVTNIVKGRVPRIKIRIEKA